MIPFQLKTFFRKLSLFSALLAFGISLNAQTTLGEITTASASCNLNIPVCDGDTIRLSPTNTSGFTNFQWYFGTVSGATEINGASGAQNVHSVSNDSIVIVSAGGTYILTGEYATPTGCATLNDTITLDFQAIPDLATIPDTICVADGESVDLSTLVTDNNSAPGTALWYASLADAIAETPTISTTVNPASTTTYYVRQTSTGTAACYDIDSVQIVVSCLSLGNMVWYDTNNDGLKDAGESLISDVVVNLFLDTDGNGLIEGAEQTPVATQATVAGLYLFENLREGQYFVGIPSSEFGSGEPLEHLHSSQTSRAADGTISEVTADDADTDDGDLDDNGTEVISGFYAGGILSAQVELLNRQEPTGENPDNSSNDDLDDNLTVDFGFYGMSIGSLVFSDDNNNATFDSGSESGIAGATVTLYSSNGTQIATTTTDANGQYVFTNLPEGDYIVAVTTPAGTLSSDDIGTSANPDDADNDDNGITIVTTETRSATFTLDAGMAPTLESDEGTAQATGLGNPLVQTNASSPDENNDLRVDFGFKPVCPVISNPTGAQTICATDSGTDITVDFSTNTENIRFVRFDDIQTGNAMYSGGTGLGTVTVTGGSAPYLATLTFDTNDFPNASNTTPDTFYVYGVLENTPIDPTCRPFQEIRVIVNPLPLATAASLTLCETVVAGGTADFTLANATTDVENGQTGMTVTYHASQAHADAGTPAVTNLTAANGTIVYARVENTQGCYATAAVTLNVNNRPQFTLTLPTTCPSDNPTVKITLGTNADADPNVSVESGAAVLFSSLTPGDNASEAIVTITDGLVLNTSNSIRLTNSTTCDANQNINPGSVIPQVCLPVKIEQLNNK